MKSCRISFTQDDLGNNDTITTKLSGSAIPVDTNELIIDFSGIDQWSAVKADELTQLFSRIPHHVTSLTAVGKPSFKIPYIKELAIAILESTPSTVSVFKMECSHGLVIASLLEMAVRAKDLEVVKSWLKYAPQMRDIYLAALRIAENYYHHEITEAMLKQDRLNLLTEKDPAVIRHRIAEWRENGGRLDKIKQYIVKELTDVTADNKEAVAAMLRAICELSTDGIILYSITNKLGFGTSSIEKGRLGEIAAALNTRLKQIPSHIVDDDEVKQKIDRNEKLKGIIKARYRAIYDATQDILPAQKSLFETISAHVAQHKSGDTRNLSTLDLSAFDIASLTIDDLVKILKSIPAAVTILVLGDTKRDVSHNDCLVILDAIPATVQYLNMLVFVYEDGKQSKSLAILTAAICCGNVKVRDKLLKAEFSRYDYDSTIHATLKDDYLRAVDPSSSAAMKLPSYIEKWKSLGYLKRVKGIIVDEINSIKEVNKRYLAMVNALFKCSPEGIILYAASGATAPSISNESSSLFQLAAAASIIARSAKRDSTIDMDVQKARAKNNFSDEKILKAIFDSCDPDSENDLYKNLTKSAKNATLEFHLDEINNDDIESIKQKIRSFEDYESLELYYRRSTQVRHPAEQAAITATMGVIPASITSLTWELSNEMLFDDTKELYESLFAAIPDSVSKLEVKAPIYVYYYVNGYHPIAYFESFGKLNKNVKTVTVVSEDARVFLKMINNFPNTVSEVRFKSRNYENNFFLAAAVAQLAYKEDSIQELMASRFFQIPTKATDIDSALVSLTKSKNRAKKSAQAAEETFDDSAWVKGIKELLRCDINLAVESKTVKSRMPRWVEVSMANVKEIVVQELEKGDDASKQINAMIRALCRSSPYGQILFTPMGMLSSCSIGAEGPLRDVLGKLTTLVSQNTNTELEQETVDCLMDDRKNNKNELLMTLHATYKTMYLWLDKKMGKHYPLTSTQVAGYPRASISDAMASPNEGTELLEITLSDTHQSRTLSRSDSSD